MELYIIHITHIVKGGNNAVWITSSRKYIRCDKITLLAEWTVSLSIYLNMKGTLMYHNKCGTCV